MKIIISIHKIRNDDFLFWSKEQTIDCKAKLDIWINKRPLKIPNLNELREIKFQLVCANIPVRIRIIMSISL